MIGFLTDPYFYLVLFVGLCLGSFATAMAFRLPKDISLWQKQRSTCPSCDHVLGLRDLIPLFSWALQKGKCRYCAAVIGLRYPLIELATVLCCAAFYMTYGFHAQTFALLALVPFLMAMMDIDLRHKIIPDELNMAVLSIGVVVMALGFRHLDIPDVFIQAVLGSAVYGGAAWVLRFIFQKLTGKEALGLGDVKLFSAAGFWLGTSIDTLAAFMILSGAGGVALALVWKKITGEEQFPFGPAIVAAFLVLILWQKIIFI